MSLHRFGVPAVPKLFCKSWFVFRFTWVPMHLLIPTAESWTTFYSTRTYTTSSPKHSFQFFLSFRLIVDLPAFPDEVWNCFFFLIVFKKIVLPHKLIEDPPTLGMAPRCRSSSLPRVSLSYPVVDDKNSSPNSPGGCGHF